MSVASCRRTASVELGRRCARSRRAPLRPARAGTRAGRAGTGRAGCRRAASRRAASMCSPAAAATPTGAAESHSYCPPPCAYTSASPSTTAIVFAPAEPIGTSSASSTSARYSATAAGACATRAAGPCRCGGASAGGGAPVESTLACAGQRDRGALGVPLEHERDVHGPVGCGRSPHSRVPSSGSTIHTRSAVESDRVVLRLLRQHRVVGSRARARRGEDQVVAERGRLRPSSRLRRAWQLEQQLAGFARDVGRRARGRPLSSSPARRRRLGALGGRGREQRLGRAAQHSRVDRLHERDVDVGAARR